jgi:hypothetical protein
LRWTRGSFDNEIIEMTEYFSKMKIEYIVVGLALLAGAIYTAIVYQYGLTMIFVDQNSHINIARQVFDSMTPGASQVGFWPPLLHVIMAIPVYVSDFLFVTGLGSAVSIVPFLAMGAYFVYKLTYLYTENRMLGFLASLLFFTNPYILYYSVTPMMETLFVANLFGVAYFLGAWMKIGSFKYIFGAGVFTALASLSRFEGLVLLPLIVIIIFYWAWRSGMERHKIEAMLIMYALVAATGYIAIMAYGAIFAGNPLEFATGAWSAQAQQADMVLLSKNSLLESFRVLTASAIYMIGLPQVFFSLVAFILVFIITPTVRRLQIFSISLVLLSPFVMILLSLYSGNTVIYLPEFPPEYTFFNERYGLSLLPFAVFISVMLAGATLFDKFKGRQRLVQHALAWPVVLILVASNLVFFYDVTFIQRFAVLEESVGNSAHENGDHAEIGSVLSREYDHGQILITRALHNFVIPSAGLPIRNYIHESNYRYYDQALEEPWLFARFVVMYNPAFTDPDSWRYKNEQVTVRWADSEQFLQFYDLIHENDFSRLYKINHERAVDIFHEQGLRLAAVPSLNPSIHVWNAETIHDDMLAENYIRDYNSDEEGRRSWIATILFGDTLSGSSNR